MSFVFRCGVCLLTLAVAAQAADEDAAKPDPGPVPVPTAGFSVKAKPGVAGMHPRLFLTAKSLEALREKVKDPRLADAMIGFFVDADEIVAETPPVNPPNTEDPFRGFGNRPPTVAMAYLLTKDTKYLDSAKIWLKAIISYPSWAGDVDLGAGHICFGMALAYDWLFEYLTPEERREIEASLTRHTRIMVQRAAGGRFWGDAYFQNHSWINYAGINAAAMALYDLDPAEFQPYLDFFRAAFETTYRHLGIDGGYYEGIGYGAYATSYLIYYIEALRGFSGEDLRDMSYLKGATRYFCDSLMSDGHSSVVFTDWSATRSGLLGDALLYWLAATHRDGTAEWLRRLNREGVKIPQSSGKVSPFALLWVDPSIEPKVPDDRWLTSIYPDLGQVFFRTGWGPDAAAVSLICGPPGGMHIARDWASFGQVAVAFGHVHPSANSFTFWADDAWRVGTPGGFTRFKATRNENVWMVSGKGQRGEALWFEAETYVGQTSQPHLVMVNSSAGADYVVGEAAPAYDPACQLTQFRRHLLFVKKPRPYVVVYDRLVSSEVQTWTSYLHAFTPYTVQGSLFENQAPSQTYGRVYGPGRVSLGTSPLTVIRQPDSKQVESGFELTATPDGKAKSTWLVTVIGVDQPPNVSLKRYAPTPLVEVDSDVIEWNAKGGVTFNGKTISENLLKEIAPPAAKPVFVP